jgi:hypothetical protein
MMEMTTRRGLFGGIFGGILGLGFVKPNQAQASMNWSSLGKVWNTPLSSPCLDDSPDIRWEMVDKMYDWTKKKIEQDFRKALSPFGCESLNIWHPKLNLRIFTDLSLHRRCMSGFYCWIEGEDFGKNGIDTGTNPTPLHDFYGNVFFSQRTITACIEVPGFFTKGLLNGLEHEEVLKKFHKLQLAQH